MNLLGTLFVAYAACEAILLLLSIPLGVIWDTRRPTWLGLLVLVVVGGLIGSSLIGIFTTTGPQIAGVNFLSFVGFVLSGGLGLWLLWGVLRSGRL